MKIDYEEVYDLIDSIRALISEEDLSPEATLDKFEEELSAREAQEYEL